MKQLQVDLDGAEHAVIAFRKELNPLLDHIQQQTVIEMKKKHSKIQRGISNRTDEANQQITILNEAINRMKKTEGNKSQEFVSLKLSQKILLEGEIILRANYEDKHERISFTADECIKSYLASFKTFNRELTTKSSTVYKVKSRHEINVKVLQDTSVCRNLGSCILADGTVLLADRNNSRIKRVNLSSERVVDHISLSEPRVISCLGQHEAIVTRVDRSLQVVSLAREMTTTKTIKFEHACFGTAVVSNRIFMTDAGKSVFILDMAGRELKLVRTNTIGQSIFNDNRHVAASNDGKRVFVADHDNGLVILDSEGNHVKTYKYNKVSKCQCVCADGTNLFICDYDSGNIVQLDKDYTFTGKIAEVKNPLSMCFDEKSKRLVVTNESDFITVLDLVQK